MLTFQSVPENAPILRPKDQSLMKQFLDKLQTMKINERTRVKLDSEHAASNARPTAHKAATKLSMEISVSRLDNVLEITRKA